MKDFERCYQKVFKVVSKDELIEFSFMKIRMLTEYDYLEEALIEIDHAKNQFPNDSACYAELCVDIYKFLNDYENLWRVTVKLVPSLKESTPDDIYLFIEWEQLFSQHTAGLNRETKRRMR